jgi:hypothetical protein
MEIMGFAVLFAAILYADRRLERYAGSDFFLARLFRKNRQVKFDQRKIQAEPERQKPFIEAGPQCHEPEEVQFSSGVQHFEG